MEWHHMGFPLPKEFKTQLSAGKIVASVFWDSEGVVHVNFLSHGVKISAQYYSNLFRNDVHQVNQKKRPEKLSKIIQLHDKFHKGDNGNNGLGNHEQTSLKPHFTPSNFQLFGPMKVNLGGQKFQTDAE
jgi:hypothetical protein